MIIFAKRKAGGAATKLANNAGMTLVELILAAGIIATALSIIFGSLISISVLSRLNETRAQGILATSSVLEEINTLPIRQVLEYVPPAIHAPGYYHQVDLDLVTPANDGSAPTVIHLPITPGSVPIPNPVEVRVTLTWQDERGRTYRVQQSTLRGE